MSRRKTWSASPASLTADEMRSLYKGLASLEFRVSPRDVGKVSYLRRVLKGAENRTISASRPAPTTPKEPKNE